MASEEGNKEERESAQIYLLGHIFETSEDKLPELTNVPLDQVRPLSMMRMYIQELQLMGEQILKAQVEYSKYRAQYYPGERVLTEEDFADELKDIREGTGRYLSLAKKWIFYWLQFRRSIQGDHLSRAGVLAQDQIAATQPGEEGIDYDKVQ